MARKQKITDQKILAKINAFAKSTELFILLRELLGAPQIESLEIENIKNEERRAIFFVSTSFGYRFKFVLYSSVGWAGRDNSGFFHLDDYIGIIEIYRDEHSEDKEIEMDLEPIRKKVECEKNADLMLVLKEFLPPIFDKENLPLPPIFDVDKAFESGEV